tara:strand:- start:425 stop:841 length:417 start_codon:yes stop_codon:yes gene_type:complete
MHHYRHLFVLFSILLTACTPHLELNQLEGYWQIQQVRFQNGSSKKFVYTSTVDFFKLIDDKEGILKKLDARVDGKFFANEAEHRFTIVKNQKDNTLIQIEGEEFITYELKKLTPEELHLYDIKLSRLLIYSKFTPLNF